MNRNEIEVDEDGDGYPSTSDCSDDDASAHPGAPELCNGQDDDCDGTIDVGASDAQTWYVDQDGDGHGSIAGEATACEAPLGYVAAADDCDDADSAFHPGAAESCEEPIDYNCDGQIAYADADADGDPACTDCNDGDSTTNSSAVETCNGIDDDCDGTTDEADAIDALTYFADADGDGYGTETTTVACNAPEGYAEAIGDCDDADPDKNPGAVDPCDQEIDLNCDGSVSHADEDADGFDACSDCDDGDSEIRPGSAEVCDAVDNDCDGSVDESDAEDASTWYRDADGDGYGSDLSARGCTSPLGYVAEDGDCDDGSYAQHPNGVETCNGEDDDCDGSIDDSAIDATTWYTDADHDGYGDASLTVDACEQPYGTSENDLDCSDSSASIRPGGTEKCDPNDLDEDCDGNADDFDDSATGQNAWYSDLDADGYGAGDAILQCDADSTHTTTSVADCNDGDAAVKPSASETCNGIDDDCDGSVDDDAVDGSWYFADVDGDGFGDAAAAIRACSTPSGYVANDDDCNDTNEARHPGAEEYCDGADDDCDSIIDEYDAADAVVWYEDYDGDGYGTTAVSVLQCYAPDEGYVADDTDCNDLASSVNPGATEICDSLDVDEDCDGLSDVADASVTGTTLYYEDADSDGYGSGSGKQYCEPTGNYKVFTGGDCDDRVSTTHPGATELCNATDDNCDGSKLAVLLDTGFDDVPTELDLNGTANVEVSGLRLTQAVDGQAGNALLTSTFKSDRTIDATFDVLMYGTALEGADGVAFALLDGGTASSWLGANGYGMGVYGKTGYAVTFDTWKNGTDPSGNFVGFVNTSNLALLASTNVATTMDGEIPVWHSVVFSYVPSGSGTATVTVDFDGARVIDNYSFTPPSTLRLGFGAGTGGENNYQAVDNAHIECQ